MMYNSPKAKREVGFIGAEVANKAYSIRCVKDSPERIAAQKAAVEAAAKAAAEAKAQLQKWDKQPLEGGKEYTWSEAMKACPKGKHLPTNDEWNKLGEPLSQLSKSEFRSEIEKEYSYGEGNYISGWSATRNNKTEGGGTSNRYVEYSYYYYNCYYSYYSDGEGVTCRHDALDHKQDYQMSGETGNTYRKPVRCVKD